MPWGERWAYQLVQPAEHHIEAAAVGGHAEPTTGALLLAAALLVAGAQPLQNGTFLIQEPAQDGQRGQPVEHNNTNRQFRWSVKGVQGERKR